MPRPRILYVTDLDYPARGRTYGDEDRFVTARLDDRFDVTLCTPLDAERSMPGFDAVVVRNSGPVIHYRAAHDSFRRAALEGGIRVFNELSGKADMIGKQYLLDLSGAGFPVIPTVDRWEDLGRLPTAESYVVKPTLGSDSIGMRIVRPDQLAEQDLDGTVLVQPSIPFVHEVSFYVVGDRLQYALVAPNPDERWDLQPFIPSAADHDFAMSFVEWNDIRFGIQRVDACRTADGDLLLMELEDLNPYLSLDVVDGDTQDRFLSAMADSIECLIDDR